MKVGDLVFTKASTSFKAIGIITQIEDAIDHQLWYDQRIINVLYPDNGEELKWAEENLEVVS